MLTQYEILSMCLSELKKSHLPIIDKLKLEVQLIQAKRLLLDDEIGAKVKGVVSSEREFRGLYHEVKQLCSRDGESGEVGGLISHLQGIKENLKMMPFNRKMGVFI